MGIKATFKMSDVKSRLALLSEVVERQQIAILMRLGEMCVTHARTIPAEIGFHDRTGNLRSSIGYGVYKDGEKIQGGGFRKVSPKNPKLETIVDGTQVGTIYCDNIGAKTEGLVLVCVAGMNYARHVESTGRDVLTSAKQLAKTELPRMVNELIGNIKTL